MMLSEPVSPKADVSPSATPTATQYLVVAQDTLVSAASVVPLGSGTAEVGFSKVPL